MSFARSVKEFAELLSLLGLLTIFLLTKTLSHMLYFSARSARRVEKSICRAMWNSRGRWISLLSSVMYSRTTPSILPHVMDPENKTRSTVLRTAQGSPAPARTNGANPRNKEKEQMCTSSISVSRCRTMTSSNNIPLPSSSSTRLSLQPDSYIPRNRSRISGRSEFTYTGEYLDQESRTKQD